MPTELLEVLCNPIKVHLLEPFVSPNELDAIVYSLSMN
jgi:hypothetical protein